MLKAIELLTARWWHAVHGVPGSPNHCAVDTLQLRFVAKSSPT
jgi:hypothetical protein